MMCIAQNKFSKGITQERRNESHYSSSDTKKPTLRMGPSYGLV